MATYTINPGTRPGAVELTFAAKPAEEVREALKTLKFRWNGKKGVWYGFSTAEEVAQAIGNTSEAMPAESIMDSISFRTINPGTIYEGWEGSNARTWTSDAELKAMLKEALRKCRIKATIRSNRAGYLTSITCTMQVSPDEVLTFEEWCKESEPNGDPLCHYIHPNGWNFYEDETGNIKDIFGEKYYALDPNSDEAKRIREGAAKADYRNTVAAFGYANCTIDNIAKGLKESARQRLETLHTIVASFNHDASDIITDYFDRDIYDHYAIKVV